MTNFGGKKPLQRENGNIVLYVHYMSLVTRKPVLGVCDQLRLKPVCAATEARWRLEILDIETRGTIISKQQTTKADQTAQADLRLCCSHMA